MEASLQNSQPKGKRSITKTSPLTAEGVLEILTQSFRMAEDAGYILVVDNYDNDVVITIRKVNLVSGILKEVTPKAESVTPKQ